MIDFDLTAAPVGGVLSGSGRVQESSGPIGTGVQLGGPPGGQGLLQNISVSSQTLTVTMNSSPCSAGPPLGWTIVYDADFDDPTLGPVCSPGGIVDLTINQSSVPVPLGAVPQPAIAVPTSFFDLVRGSNPALTAAESRVTYIVDLGPDDRVLVDDLQLSSGIEAFVFNQDYKCIDRMNNASGKLGGGDATPCVDDPVEPKTNARETKQLADYVTHCPTLPAWGVNGASCCEEGANEGLFCAVPADCPGGSCLPGACITHAAEYAANDLSHELFGVGVIVSPTAGKCQYDLTRRAGAVLKERWKAFRTCKKANVQTTPDDIVPPLDCDLFDDAIANLSCP